MPSDRPTFAVPEGSRLALSIGPTWSLLPLRIPSGWAIRHNGIDARQLPSGLVEVNDSEDLFWAVKLPPPSDEEYSIDPKSKWRKISVDAGWYRDHFRIVMLDPDWDHIRHTFSTPDVEDFLSRLEVWLLEIVVHGDVKSQ